MPLQPAQATFDQLILVSNRPLAQCLCFLALKTFRLVTFLSLFRSNRRFVNEKNPNWTILHKIQLWNFRCHKTIFLSLRSGGKQSAVTADKQNSCGPGPRNPRRSRRCACSSTALRSVSRSAHAYELCTLPESPSSWKKRANGKERGRLISGCSVGFQLWRIAYVWQIAFSVHSTKIKQNHNREGRNDIDNRRKIARHGIFQVHAQCAMTLQIYVGRLHRVVYNVMYVKRCLNQCGEEFVTGFKIWPNGSHHCCKPRTLCLPISPDSEAKIKATILRLLWTPPPPPKKNALPSVPDSSKETFLPTRNEKKDRLAMAIACQSRSLGSDSLNLSSSNNTRDYKTTQHLPRNFSSTSKLERDKMLQVISFSLYSLTSLQRMRRSCMCICCLVDSSSFSVLPFLPLPLPLQLNTVGRILRKVLCSDLKRRGSWRLLR